MTHFADESLLEQHDSERTLLVAARARYEANPALETKKAYLAALARFADLVAREGQKKSAQLCSF
jgi:hypothetical protein